MKKRDPFELRYWCEKRSIVIEQMIPLLGAVISDAIGSSLLHFATTADEPTFDSVFGAGAFVRSRRFDPSTRAGMRDFTRSILCEDARGWLVQASTPVRNFDRSSKPTFDWSQKHVGWLHVPSISVLQTHLEGWLLGMETEDRRDSKIHATRRRRLRE